MRPLRGLTVRLGIRQPGTVPLDQLGPQPLEGLAAPVYDYEPLDGFAGMRAYPPVSDPRWPDPLVFGPPGSGELQRQWLACGQHGKRRGQCLPALTGARGQAPSSATRRPWSRAHCSTASRFQTFPISRTTAGLGKSSLLMSCWTR